MVPIKQPCDPVKSLTLLPALSDQRPLACRV